MKQSHGIGDIRLDDVDEPKIQAPTDAIVRALRGLEGVRSSRLHQVHSRNCPWPGRKVRGCCWASVTPPMVCRLLRCTADLGVRQAESHERPDDSRC
jgi:hypothetical protein